MQSLIKFESNYVTFDFANKPGQQIKIIGTYDDPYFCGKDVCTILEHKDIKRTLFDLDADYKKDLKTIIEEAVGARPTASVIGIPSSKPTYNEGKAIYINEPGLYALIMKSKTHFAKTFQKFVYEQILPSIRKRGRFQLEQTIALKDDKIDELSTLVRQMDLRSKEMSMKLEGISFQNDELLENVEDLKSTSKQQTEQLETVQTRLGIAIETRAPLPRARSKQERFILIKRSQKRNGLQPEYKYYTIRAQDIAAKQSLKTQETMYNIIILLDLNCHPNSRTLYTRIKEELNRQRVVFSYNNLSIEESEIDEDSLIEHMRSIDDQKRDV